MELPFDDLPKGVCFVKVQEGTQQRIMKAVRQ